MNAPGAVTIVAHDVGAVGGMERQLARLALGLRELGYSVTVIARTCELPADAGVRFHRVPGPRRPFPLAYLWFMLAGSLAVRRWRRGLVQSTGAIVLNRVDGISVHCCHQVYRPPATRRGLLARAYVAAVALLTRTAERLCFKASRAATFVCVSEGVAAEVREHFPEAARVVTIHNGVNTDAFAPDRYEREAAALRAELGIPPDRPVAAYVGDGSKGLRHVIEALVDAPGWDLVVAGRGPVRSFQALADSLCVSGLIHWLGVVSDIHLVYALADAFVLPSGYETFSLVTFEAAASGLPILATPVNGVRELIHDGESGVLIAPRPQAIARRLCELAEDPALRSRLGGAARESALRFTWERMVAAHHELYTALAGQRQT